MEYVKVHPNVEGPPPPADFKDREDATWSHVIKDGIGDPVFFGDFDTDDGADFDFDLFRFQIGEAYQALTWAEARELGETIIALADKHEGKR